MAILLISFLQLFVPLLVFAQNQTEIPEEIMQELGKNLSELNEALIKFQNWFMTLTPEDQEKVNKKLLEEFNKINKSDSDL